MPRTAHIFLVLITVASGCVPVNAQSVLSTINTTEATDLFSGVHDALDRTINSVLRQTPDAAHRAHRNKADLEVHPSGPNAAETEMNGVSTPETNPSAAMRRLEQLRPLLDPILRSEGIPPDIAFVVIVESGGRADALSPKGARGLWQLMPETARRYGLVVNADRDERLDVEKSTRAAARYLRDLRSQFQSWPVALAAYNAGEQTVQKAIDDAQSNKFDVLSSRRLLPMETRTYVPAVFNLMLRWGSVNGFSENVAQTPPDERIVYAAQTP
jgi:hypothetical protein